MTTENIRITGYIIPDVYDRFEEFCQENKLTCSKALNMILAEYLGIETKLVEQIWIGGVSLSEFEKLKKEVQELRELFNTLSNTKSITPKNKELDEQINKVLPEPLNEKTKKKEKIENKINEEIQDKISKKIQDKINEVLSKAINQEIKEEINQSNDEEITLELNTTELAKRFNISRATINRKKKKFRENKITQEEYIQWTRTQDPEDKGWFFDENINYSAS